MQSKRSTFSFPAVATTFLFIVAIVVLSVKIFILTNENENLRQSQASVVNNTDILWHGKTYRVVGEANAKPVAAPIVIAIRVAPIRRDLICSDDKGALYRTDDPRTVVLASNGNADVFFETADGVTEYSDDLGIDWTLMEGCHAAFLYFDSPAVRKAVIFAPKGFDLKSLYKKPYIGAKKVRINQTVSDLSIEVLR